MSNTDPMGQQRQAPGGSPDQPRGLTGGFGHQAGAPQRDQAASGGEPPKPMKQQAQDIAKQARERGREMAQNASEQARDARRRLSEQAQNAAQHAKRYGNEVLSDQKNRAAAELDQFGQAVHAAGDRLHDGEDHAIADYVHALGEQIERASSYIRDRDVGSLTSDLRRVARRHPEWFLGGAFLAGLALARFAKARDPGYESGYDEDRYGTEHLSRSTVEDDYPYATDPHTGEAAGGASTNMPEV